MLFAIKNHVLALLQNDKRLVAGGDDYAAGWPGFKRPSKVGTDPTQAPLTGWINLFEEAYADDGKKHRPAIYCGNRAISSSDRDSGVDLSGGTGYKLREFVLPLVICAMATTEAQANMQVSQLKYNVSSILLTHAIESGYWYSLLLPGVVGTGIDERIKVSGEGQGATAITEAICTLPVLIKYVFTPRAAIP